MTSWLAPVVAALAAAPVPRPFFFRDDDAGWDDGALFALLDEFAAAGVAVDVAAIPRAVSRACAAELGAWVDSGLVRVHQHGFAHVDHEPAGRKCEFGPSRPAATQQADIRDGRVALEDVLGRPVDPVFTPPWNRCTAATADAVVAAGHRVLSRDVSAGLLGRPGLAEVPVTIDWSGRRHGVPITRADVGQAITDGVRGDGPVGVMLHHAVLDDAGRAAVGELLALVAASPGAAPTTIVALA